MSTAQSLPLLADTNPALQRFHQLIKYQLQHDGAVVLIAVAAVIAVAVVAVAVIAVAAAAT